MGCVLLTGCSRCSSGAEKNPAATGAVSSAPAAPQAAPAPATSPAPAAPPAPASPAPASPAIAAAGQPPRHEPVRKLEVKDLKLGKGAAAKPGRTVTIHYVGTLDDGRVFDNSRARETPLRFVLGSGEMIKGWDEGLKGMRVGGIRRLVVPPSLGYGDKGVKGVVPPDAVLTFEIELLSVK